MTVGKHSGRPAATSRRRVATLGVACVAAGVLAVAGWWNPAAVSPPSAVGNAIVTAGAPAPSASDISAASVAPARSSAAALGSTRLTPVRIRVPAIGVDAPLVRLGLTSDGALAVPARAMTAGWYTGSPVPGVVGPAVIAGHVHWSGIPAVFAHLADLTRGDRIVVSRSDGSVVTFTVDRVATYPKTRFPTALVYGSLDVPGLRLITCGGFDPVSRTYEANVIAFATRVMT